MQGMDTGFSPSVIACFTAISIPKQRTRLCCCYLQLSSLWWVKRFSCWTHSWCFHSLLLSPSWLFSFPPLNNMLKFSGWSWWRDGLFVCLSVVWRFGRWSSKSKKEMNLSLSLLSSSFSQVIQFNKELERSSSSIRFDSLMVATPPLSLILSKLPLLTVASSNNTSLHSNTTTDVSL